MAITKAYSLLAIVATIICLFIAQSKAFEVELFENKHFKGRTLTVDVLQECVDVPFEWEDMTSSLNTKECIIVYKHPKCEGPRIRLEPWTFGTAYLREINFEDKLSSISPCHFHSSPQGRDEY